MRDGEDFGGAARGGGLVVVAALLALAAEFLELVEADDGAVQLAFDGGGVAHHQSEFLAGLFGGIQTEGHFGQIAFASADAPQTPQRGGDVVDQLEFERADRLGFLEQVLEQRVEFGLVLLGQDHAAAGQPMLERIQRRTLLARGGARTGPRGDYGIGFKRHGNVFRSPQGSSTSIAARQNKRSGVKSLKIRVLFSGNGYFRCHDSCTGTVRRALSAQPEWQVL